MIRCATAFFVLLVVGLTGCTPPRVDTPAGDATAAGKIRDVLMTAAAGGGGGPAAATGTGWATLKDLQN